MQANSTLYSLRLRTIAASALIILVLISFQFFYIVPKEQALIRDTLLTESSNTLQQVASQLVSPILKRKFASVYEVVDAQIAVNTYWRGVRIVDAGGRQLYPLSAWVAAVEKGDMLLQQDIGFLDEPIGKIELVVNYSERLEASLRLSNQLAFFQLLVLGLALTAAYIMFERLIFRPLNQLSKAFAGMAAGQFDYPLPEVEAGEIGALVRDFRSARSTVATYQANLKDLKEEADQANMAKSQFLSRMSHELRTPLNAIIGFSELCLEEPGATESGRAPLHAINKSGHHLLTLIDEILELTRIEAGLTRIDIKPLALHDILDDCRMFIGNLATSHGITLSFMLLPSNCSHVFADSTRLKQCILNLLSNAIKYNRARGTVTVTCLKAAPGRVRIAISDEGPGIDDDQVERVFRPFERLAMHADSTEGTGIGLGITRQLVIMMGGTIGVDRNAGPGSTFWIELPEADDAAGAGVSAEPGPASSAPELGQQALESVSEAPASLAGVRVLVAEDNELNQKVIAAQLKSLGCPFTLAENGQAALDCYDKERFDLLLTDIMMPVMDGFELIRQIRKREALGSVRLPIVALSANATELAKSQAEAAQVDEYLTKPLQKEQLEKVLRGFLSRGPNSEQRCDLQRFPLPRAGVQAWSALASISWA